MGVKIRGTKRVYYFNNRDLACVFQRAYNTNFLADSAVCLQSQHDVLVREWDAVKSVRAIDDKFGKFAVVLIVSVETKYGKKHAVWNVLLSNVGANR